MPYPYPLDDQKKAMIDDESSIYRKEGRLNLSKLCSDKNIEILEVDFKNDNVSATLLRKGGPGTYMWTIYVNRTDSIKRKRFSIAHELGHYFSYQWNSLSKSKIDEENFVEDFAYAQRTKMMDDCESEANEIAAELLMPSGSIHNLINEGLTVEELADYFGVSESAMTVRLRNVGIFLMEDGSAIVDDGKTGTQ